MRIIIYFSGISKKNYFKKNEHNLLKPKSSVNLLFSPPPPPSASSFSSIYFFSFLILLLKKTSLLINSPCTSRKVVSRPETMLLYAPEIWSSHLQKDMYNIIVTRKC